MSEFIYQNRQSACGVIIVIY